VDEEFKQCTFTPNERRKASRSFKQLYSDLTTASKRQEEEKRNMEEFMSRTCVDLKKVFSGHKRHASVEKSLVRPGCRLEK
jgi:hypothetical protein